MTTQLNILFMALHSRVNDNGEVPVYCRLTHNQRQKRFMIGCTVPIQIWKQSKQRAFGKSAKAATVNQHVNTILQKIYKAETELAINAVPDIWYLILVRVLCYPNSFLRLDNWPAGHAVFCSHCF
jgi:hypothetical protein